MIPVSSSAQAVRSLANGHPESKDPYPRKYSVQREILARLQEVGVLLGVLRLRSRFAQDDKLVGVRDI
jgi:hypothetical protein